MKCSSLAAILVLCVFNGAADMRGQPAATSTNQTSRNIFKDRPATSDDLKRTVTKFLSAGDIEPMKTNVRDLPNLAVGLKAISFDESDYRALGDLLKDYGVHITQPLNMRGSECQGFKFLDIKTWHGRLRHDLSFIKRPQKKWEIIYQMEEFH